MRFVTRNTPSDRLTVKNEISRRTAPWTNHVLPFARQAPFRDEASLIWHVRFPLARISRRASVGNGFARYRVRAPSHACSRPSRNRMF